jgi:hypothetical protein
VLNTAWPSIAQVKKQFPAGKKMPSNLAQIEAIAEGSTTVKFRSSEHSSEPWDELEMPPYLHGIDEDTLFNGSFNWDEPFQNASGLSTPVSQLLDDEMGNDTPAPEPRDDQAIVPPDRHTTDDISESIRDRLDNGITGVESSTTSHPGFFIQREHAELPDDTVYQRETTDPRSPRKFVSRCMQTDGI